MGSGELETARAAYAARDWVTARDAFEAARAAAPLSAADLASLADALWWLGDLNAALPALDDAYRLHLAAGEVRPAAILALEIGYTLAIRGEQAQASGWMRRASRLLEDEPVGPEHGYLVYTEFEEALAGSDLDTALERAGQVHDLGRRFADVTLTALGVMGQGRVLLRQGAVERGMALLDEAMLAAVSDDLSADWAGNIYCHLMVACHEVGDLRRAGQWTQATARWCATMPGAGPFMGICRMHRAQLLTVQGAWAEAEAEARRAADELDRFDVPVAAEAHYQMGELRRQRGDLQGAEQSYRAAHRMGREPQPGLALLRLAQGRVADAMAAVTSALAGAPADALVRVRLLPAAVEIALAGADLELARRAGAELTETAETYGTPGLQAAAGHARGALHLAGGEAAPALGPLREALRLWQELEAPFDAARTRLLLARSYSMLGDRDTAALERDAARAELARLGAPVDQLDGPTRLAREHGLSSREAQVLALLAEGRSNQEIADELVLSVRTIERHLVTVYRKLGVQGRSARTAAVRYALEAGLT